MVFLLIGSVGRNLKDDYILHHKTCACGVTVTLFLAVA